MSTGFRVVLALLCVGGTGVGEPAPGRFENEIARFEAADRDRPPPRGAVVCTGSSSMRLWHDQLARDLAPLTVIPRGFGGSTMEDLIRCAPRIVLPYAPRAVVVYEGDNDIAGGAGPEQVAESFDRFVALVHRELPECRVYFLSIKPSPSRWKLWPRMSEANRRIADRCARHPRLCFVDVAAVMLEGDGTPRGELFAADGLHMNRAGYEAWRGVLRPVLLAAESGAEPAAGAAIRYRALNDDHAARAAVVSRLEAITIENVVLNDLPFAEAVRVLGETAAAGEAGAVIDFVIRGPRTTGDGTPDPFAAAEPGAAPAERVSLRASRIGYASALDRICEAAGRRWEIGFNDTTGAPLLVILPPRR